MAILLRPTGEGRWSSIDPADIAAVAVKALLTKGHEGQGYTLTGDKPMNGAEYAQVLSEVLGRPIKFVDVPPELAKEQMLMTGMPAEYVEAVMNLMAAMRDGYANFVTDTIERLIGRKPTTFAEWSRRHAAAFQ